MKHHSSLVPDGYEVIESLPFPLLIIDESFRIVYINHNAESFLGISRTNLQRYSLETVFPDTILLLKTIEQARQKNCTVACHEVKAGLHNGLQKEVTLYVVPFENSKEFTVITLYDFSMMQTIKHTQEGHSSQATKDITLLLAHEIKNPLSGIRGAAQLLKSALVSEDDRNLTDLICFEVDRIKEMVDDRLNLNHRGSQLKKLNIHSVLNHAKKVVEQGCAAHLKLVTSYDPSLPLVAGNENLLIQVFINLIKNAVEAVEDQRHNGIISIITRYYPDLVMKTTQGQHQNMLPLLVIIRDNGKGIPEQMKNRLFDPFVSSKPNGLGIGLTLCKRIILDHGGIIRIESRQGQTDVKIYLPVLDSVT